MNSIDITPKKGKDITPRQRLFVLEYMVDLNATQAAIRAGYSERSAEVEGCRLLRNARVAAFVQEALDKRAETVAITAQDVLESIVRIRGKAEDADRFGDALKANELLGKHLKLFTDKLEVTGKDGKPLVSGLPELYAAIRDRKE